MRLVVAPRGMKNVLYGEIPFGWQLSKDRSYLVKAPEEQRVLSVVKHMYFVLRLPMRDIVDALAESGVKNRRGKTFGLSRVFEMVHADPKATPKEASGSAGRAKKRAV